jgi:microcompartment protein CcmK/EutM
VFIARVIGRVWSAAQNVSYHGVPLMIVQPLDEKLQSSGEPEISADALNCCEGEIVWVEGGKEASYALPTKYGPSDSSIVAKIDALDVAITLAKGEAARLPGAAS